MGNSLVKYVQERQHNGEPIYWGRADIDGAPFKGKPIIAPEAELEDRLTKVYETKVKVFNLGIDKDRDEFNGIIDRITNGWAVKLDYDKQWVEADKTWICMLAWAEQFVVDGKPSFSHKFS